MKYYITENGKAIGPFTLEELRLRGLTPDSPVWNEQMKDWTPAGQVPELAPCLSGEPKYDCNSASTCSPSYEPCPKTWLWQSIVATLLCCLPLGIVGIIKASQVESLYRSGQYEEAERVSREAGKWTKWSFIIGLIITLVYLFLIIGGFLAQ